MPEMGLMGKRLYGMTVSELQAEAERYEKAGNFQWAEMCRDAVDLTLRISEAFRKRASAPITAGDAK
jgi:hypothetical protein